MQWSAPGLIIGVRRHGETSVIVEAMVKGRGRCMGLVRGGRSSRMSATLQTGNDVDLTWRARLEDHLGTFTIELLHARAAALIVDRARLNACQVITEHLRLLPERDPHDRLLGAALDILDGEAAFLPMMADLARFELLLLDELGFGLDLFSCAVTGETTGLTHVSPKSGRAVSASAAAPYADKLLALPAFLRNGGEPSQEDIVAGFRLTGHFLERHVWSARQVIQPVAREQLLSMLAKPL